jgi:polyhydroxyalkanoate synthase
MDEKGFLPGRAMGDTFNMIRANDLIWTVAVNRYLLGKEAPAFDLLYWNNDATRMPKSMHAFYLNRMYLANDLVKPGAIAMRGTPIDLRAIANDLYIVATAEDHIAPWRTVYALTQHVSGNTRFRLGHSGHIAGIVSPPGGKKGHWHGVEGAGATVNPPTADAWKAQAPKHEGSWWPDWSAWNAERSGDRVAARAPGAHPEFPAIAAAPGAYVLVT